MKFRFWRRRKKPNLDAEASALPPAHDDTPVPSWPGTLSAGQILALQKLVGNQALLPFLVPAASTALTKRPPA